MELLRRDPQSYFRTLVDFVNLSPSLAPDPQAANVGWGGVTLAVKRCFNGYRLGLADWRKARQPVSYFMIHRLCNVIDASVPNTWHKRVERSMKDFISQRCQAYFKSSNCALADMTGLDLAGYGYDV